MCLFFLPAFGNYPFFQGIRLNITQVCVEEKVKALREFLERKKVYILKIKKIVKHKTTLVSIFSSVFVCFAKLRSRYVQIPVSGRSAVLNLQKTFTAH